MKTLNWKWDKQNPKVIYAKPVEGVIFEIVKISEQKFECIVPDVMHRVSYVEVKQEYSSEAKALCQMLWETWGYLAIREAMLYYERNNSDSKYRILAERLYKIYNDWMLKLKLDYNG